MFAGVNVAVNLKLAVIVLNSRHWLGFRLSRRGGWFIRAGRRRRSRPRS
jgi:hypothetical protein